MELNRGEKPPKNPKEASKEVRGEAEGFQAGRSTPLRNSSERTRQLRTKKPCLGFTAKDVDDLSGSKFNA